MARHTLARSMHDLGLAAWFGGALMGAVGVNGSAASLRDPAERSAAATIGWTRWAPVSAVAIGAHLAGSVQLLRTERYRVRHQNGVARSSAVKTGLTAAALGVTAYSGLLNRKMAAAGHVPVEGATEPGPNTPAEIATAQKQLKATQWLIPALTGGLVATTSWQSEQMRPKQMLAGLLPSLSLPSNTLPAAGALGAAALAQLINSRSKATPTKDNSGHVPNVPLAATAPVTPTPTTTPGTAPAVVDMTLPKTDTPAGPRSL